MKTGNEHTSAEFDQLLALALLERTEIVNETNTIVMAQHVLSSAAIPALHNNTVSRKLSRDFSRNRIFLNGLLIAVLIGGITLISIWKFNQTRAAATVNETYSVPGASYNNGDREITSAQTSPVEKNRKPDNEMVMPVTADSIVQTASTAVEPVSPAYFSSGSAKMYIPEPMIDDEADIPVLTEAQKKKNDKLKLQMFRDISKKKTFTLVPAGASWRNGERFTVNAFYMQCAEVSNWQYHVFLNDLIMQGRTDDYRACKPADGNWKAVGIPEFENTYANDEGYEKMPVLNISRAAAELFCEWWTVQMGMAIDNKDIKWSQNAKPDFRLPSDIEWMRAGRGDDSTLQFPWGMVNNALQNKKGCYMCNFNYSISKDVLTPIEADGKNCISVKQTKRNVVTTAGRAIDTLVLGPEYCYNPGIYGQYCLLGNAAEMVWTYDPAQPSAKGAARAMGGSWNSHADNVRIESKEQFVGVTDPNVNIGFRMVMVYK